jgi:hypothetical protein
LNIHFFAELRNWHIVFYINLLFFVTFFQFFDDFREKAFINNEGHPAFLECKSAIAIFIVLYFAGGSLFEQKSFLPEIIAKYELVTVPPDFTNSFHAIEDNIKTAK